MVKAILRVVLFSFCLMGVAAFPQTQQTTHKAIPPLGAEWKQMSQAEKAAWIDGYEHGVVVAAPNASALARLLPYTVPLSETIARIDRFYSDSANAEYPVAGVITLIAAQEAETKSPTKK